MPGTYWRPVENPTAPSVIAFQTSPFILFISGIVGERSAVPITARRTVLWPKRVAKLTAAPESFTAASALPTSSADEPQLPATIVVTPMRTKLAAAGWSAISSAWVWTSMKPGATTSPVASMRSVPSPAAILPIASTRPPLMPTSARRGGVPVPSTTRPPVITMSNLAG